MSLKSLSTLGLRLAFVLTAMLSARAELVTITAEGELEHLVKGAYAPAVVQNRPRAIVSLVLDRTQGPVSTDANSATYRPVAATLTLDGTEFPLSQAQFVVERFAGAPASPGYAYLIRGSTPAGWFFSLRSGSTSAIYAPDFSIPTAMPVGEPDFAHDVTLRDETLGWHAFGDGALATVTCADALIAETP